MLQSIHSKQYQHIQQWLHLVKFFLFPSLQNKILQSKHYRYKFQLKKPTCQSQGKIM